MTKKKKQKVLIIRLSAMGDVIFTIPLANILKSNGLEVSWLVSEKGYDLVKNNPSVDKTILAPVEKWKKSGNFIKNFLEYLSILKQIRKEHYDIAIDTQLIFKSLYWMMFCGAKRKIVSKNSREFSILGGNEVIPPTRIGYEPHAADGYLKFAQYLGYNVDNPVITLPEISKQAKKETDELLKSIREKPFMVIAPETTWETKHWSRDNWKNLVLKMKDELSQKYDFVFCGTKKGGELISYISNGDFLNLSGRTNHETLRGVLSRAELVISLDSGITHLAWALQKPKIVSIFCSTPESLYAPKGNRYLSVSSKDICPPCHKRKCPKGTNECTNYPSVESVYKSVKKLLFEEN